MKYFLLIWYLIIITCVLEGYISDEMHEDLEN